jgi:hypothetical protein
MAEESSEEKLARLEAENKALKDQIEQRKPGQLRLKLAKRAGFRFTAWEGFPLRFTKSSGSACSNMRRKSRLFSSRTSNSSKPNNSGASKSIRG